MRTKNMRAARLVRSVGPLVAAAACGLGGAGVASAAVYTGNGGTGFGGPVGGGSLSVTDDAAGNVTISLTTSAAHPSGLDTNNLVIYVSTGAAGLSDTTSLTDDGDANGTATTVDAGRESISGYNDGSTAQGAPQNPTGTPPGSRSVIAFPSGFQATYAFSFANAYDGLFRLPTQAGDPAGTLLYVTGAAPVNNNNTLTIPLADLGLTQGQSFSFVATDIDGASAYRSNETIGPATLSTNPGPDLSTDGNPGFNNLITFTAADTYRTTAVPEPAGLAALAVAGGTLANRRRRRAR